MNTRLKTLLGILAAAIVIALIYFCLMRPNMSSSDMATTTPETATSSTTGTKAGVPAKGVTHTATGTTITSTTPAALPTILWSFHVRGKDPSSQQYTDVTLTVNDDVYELGTVIGMCKTLADADIAGVGEISAIQCMTSGDTNEVGVFKQGTGYVVKKGTVKKGTQGNSDMRSAFTVIQTIK